MEPAADVGLERIGTAQIIRQFDLRNNGSEFGAQLGVDENGAGPIADGKVQSAGFDLRGKFERVLMSSSGAVTAGCSPSWARP